ncbi:MAG: hypothetical protein RSB38_08165 [Oscillospiraceae bacterium]
MIKLLGVRHIFGEKSKKSGKPYDALLLQCVEEARPGSNVIGCACYEMYVDVNTANPAFEKFGGDYSKALGKELKFFCNRTGFVESVDIV